MRFASPTLKQNDENKATLLRILSASIAIFSVILGVFVGPALQKIAPPLFDDKNLPYVVFISIAVLVLFSTALTLFLFSTTLNEISSLRRKTSIIADVVGPRVEFKPYEEATIELQRRTQEAKFEILVLSNYKRYDWTKHQPIEFDSSNSEMRRRHYESSQAKLLRVQGSQFRFVKIVQIPEGCNLNEVFLCDGIYQDDCKFIVDLSNADPKFANLRVSEIIFQNTFCVIDRSFLYLEFDNRNALKKRLPPFIMIVDDKDSLLMSKMVSLFEDINAVAKRIDDIPRIDIGETKSQSQT